jgi:hypothetical protein
VSPGQPIGEPAIVVALDDQVEKLIFDVGTKNEQRIQLIFIQI